MTAFTFVGELPERHAAQLFGTQIWECATCLALVRDMDTHALMAHPNTTEKAEN